MNLHLLRMFLAVVDEGGFSRAAEVLHVSQSAVSKGVRELEHQLGLRLIEDRRDIRLTEAGSALLPHARSLFALERVAAEEIDDRLRLRRGRLRIGASTTVAAYWLPPVLADFMRRYPGLQVDMRVGNTGDVARAVIDCTADVGFVEGEVELPGVECRFWRDDPMTLVVGTDLETAPCEPGHATLERATWLLREAGSGTRQVTEAFFAAHRLTAARRVEIGSNEAIARIVAAGGGVAILPTGVVRDFLASGRIRALAGEGFAPPPRPLYRLEFRGRRPTPALEALLRCLEEPAG